MTATVLIVAAGSGLRAAQGVPKQYVRFGNKTVLAYTLEAFLHHPLIDRILVVIAEGHEELFKETAKEVGGDIAFCIGGDTRQKSVFKGLQHLANSPPTHVLIHDAARPFVSAHLVERVIAGLQNNIAVLPVLALSDTLKQVADSHVVKTIDRETLFLAQTPQGFKYTEILNAHQQADAEENIAFTDDASIAEWLGLDVAVITGDTQNVKITTAEDIETAAMLVRSPIPDIRCGEGFDVHKFGPGDHLTLCGIDIPFSHCLVGHSDADVALHALTDAILGAIASGDIGSHFPPSESRWRGQSSDLFLAHACTLVANMKGRILNIDVTIICEHPKIGPLRDQMRARIAEITQIDTSRISVKATTTEGLGFTGRKEGIAARATVSVFLGMIP